MLLGAGGGAAGRLKILEFNDMHITDGKPSPYPAKVIDALNAEDGDLVLGCGDGSVRIYRNTTAQGMPVLVAPVEIVAKCATYGRARLPAGKAGAKKPVGPERGYRAKVWVADWNGDGRGDLLVGDCVSLTEPAPQLTAEQTAERDRLLKEQQALRASNAKITARIQKQLEVECGFTLRNAPAEKRPEVLKVWRKLLNDDSEYQNYRKTSQALYQKLRPFQAKRSTHGFVWVYLRKGPRTL